VIPVANGRLAADKVYVIHVRTGAEDRAASIEAQLQQRGIAFEYVLDGDMEDLEPVLLDRYFTGMMKRVHPKTSCCCKHIIAYSRMMRDGHQSALILEDDIELSVDFVEALNASVAELRARDDARPDTAVISLENSGLTPVVSSEPGVSLHRADHGRCTGAYWLGRGSAALFLYRAETDKVDRYTDHFQNIFFQSGEVDIWWREPPVAEQGSHSGRFDSLLDGKRSGLLKRTRWLTRKAYSLWVRTSIERFRAALIRS
jgi:GR25 family glycosyltransferase involved in LPS biosynthesis